MEASLQRWTIFEYSPIGLDKWLCAIWLISNAEKGISSYEIHRAISVTQKTGWFMLHRIRIPMQTGLIEKLSSNVEYDETFSGSAVKDMRIDKSEAKIKGRSSVEKVA